MKRIKNFFYGLTLIFIISLAFGIFIGISIYPQSRQQIMESHKIGISNEPYSDDLIYGEYPLATDISLNIVANDKPIINLENNDDYIVITCTPQMLFLSYILVPFILFFGFILIIYIPIEIVSIIKPHENRLLENNSEKNTISSNIIDDGYPQKLSELPQDISIYSLILLRFSQSIPRYFGKKSYEVYLNSITNKQKIDRLYEELFTLQSSQLYRINYGNMYYSIYTRYLRKNYTDYELNNTLWEELFQKGFLQSTHKYNIFVRIIMKIYNYTIGNLFDLKNNNNQNGDAIKEVNSDQKWLVPVLLTIIGLSLVFIFMIKLPLLFIIVAIILIYYSITLPAPLAFTPKASSLKQKLIEYEKNYLSKKNSSTYSSKEALYMNILNHSWLI